ncbi:4-hydroxy-tetrahydrodipicolinate synthase [bacterium HR33]|nr:4-hydroxy-tetrahydrodipicolinate synthase [bacterium HR33]
MKRVLKGVLVPITTPFDAESGDVAPVALRQNARALLEAGAAGLVAAGSTGEAALLSEREFEQIVGWMRDVVPDERWLLAGAGRESTRGTIAACRAAAEAGADAVLVRAPSYYAPVLAQNDLVAHFRRIADSSPVPVLLYNIPKYTGITFSESLIAALADHENIVGAKDSSGDLKLFAAYRDAAPAWAWFIGSGSRYYAGLELGAAGGILAVACFATSLAVSIGEAFEAGDKSKAGAAQEVLAPLSREIVDRLGIPGIKAAMDLVGLIGGPVRAPLSELGEKERSRIAELLAAAGLLPAAGMARRGAVSSAGGGR